MPDYSGETQTYVQQRIRAFMYCLLNIRGGRLPAPPALRGSLAFA